jgi:PIN domain nuclease of toxin-antitoxin system
MRLILDTHVFLWYISADPELPASFRTAGRDPANDVYLSVARSTDCYSPKRCNTG